MSYKNQLQEYYQKRGLDIPTYESVNLGDKPHEPLWQSTVKTVDGLEARSGFAAKKTQSEIEAAMICLNLIKSSPSVKKEVPLCESYEVPEKPKGVLLIDLENVPKAAKFDYSKKYKDYHIIGFVGKYNHGLLKDEDAIESIMELCITDAVCKDAADHALTFHAGFFAKEYMDFAPDIDFVVLSSDKFSVVPVEHLKKFGFPNAKSITSVKDL